MKALVKAKNEPGIWLEEVPVPEYGINDVLIKIHKTSICGTDIHIYNWDEWAEARLPIPLIIGHEFCGEIVAVGKEVRGLKQGMRVSGECHLTCGLCRNCRAGRQYLCRNVKGAGYDCTGCFADYFVLPATNVIVLPDDFDFSLAAILDPFGNAAHCALEFEVAGEDVLITGAGPLGIMAVAIVRHLGARNVVITDVNDYRLQLASKMGVTRAVNVGNDSLATVIAELGMLEGFDVGLEMSGNGKAINDMLSVMNHGGKIALLGIPSHEIAINWNHVIFKGLHLQGIYGRKMYETWYKMIAMLQSGLDISAVITHHFPIDDYEQAFQLTALGQSGKVILDWV